MQDRREEELLKQQIMDIMNEENQSPVEQEYIQKPRRNNTKKKKKRRFIKIVGIIALVLLILIAFLFGTKIGRSIIYKLGSNFIYGNMQNEDNGETNEREHVAGTKREDYVTNYLIIGIEEFGGARNTDSMMIATINTKDDTVKLTSLLRDSYVDIPGYKANKLNSAYAKGGVNLLIETIELNYKIQIDGYASVNFDSFEKIVDLLGGVTIELGKEEAEYLNKTNYISKKSNRNVKPGVNKLNGNQVMGYVRVRKVKTLGGAHSDYGRIVRQQRVLQAIFDSYMSPKNIFRIVPLTKECLSYVKTDLSNKQIEKAIESIVENKITTLKTFRIPVDGAFSAPLKYNGIGYPLVLDWDVNRVELYKFIFSYTEDEAREALATLQK